MSSLAPLLDVQNLDLARDRLGSQRESLPERRSLGELAARLLDLDRAHASLGDRRSGLAHTEHGLGAEVSAIAERARTVEATLYSGTVRAAKELLSLQEEIRLFRVRQSEIEGREMTLLEEIDRTEHEIAANRRDRTVLEGEMQVLEASLAAAEAAIDAELAALAESRRVRIQDVPPALVADYEKLRGRERLAGRAVAQLVEGDCSACRMKLPRLELSRIKAQADDALVHCVHCARILVR